jgi:hypothetical protein
MKQQGEVNKNRLLFDVVIVGGLGHVGLPLGLVFADKGLKVCLYDTDRKKAEIIKQGIMPFMEYGALINLIITIIPVFWYWRKYPEARKEVLIVLALFLLWDLLLFDFGLSAMKWLGFAEGL